MAFSNFEHFYLNNRIQWCMQQRPETTRANNGNTSWPMVNSPFSLAIKFHGAYQLLALRLALPILSWIFLNFHPFSAQLQPDAPPFWKAYVWARGECVKRAKTPTETMAICKQQPAWLGSIQHCNNIGSNILASFDFCRLTLWLFYAPLPHYFFFYCPAPAVC